MKVSVIGTGYVELVKGRVFYATGICMILKHTEAL